VTGVEPHVRVVVDRVEREPSCGLRLGDYFDVVGTRVLVPNGKSFCLSAMAAVFPVLQQRLGNLPPGDWLERKPWIRCPDAVDGVVMRLDRLPDIERRPS
jgi:uncharacterized repeat protein (TIGR04076 family)